MKAQFNALNKITTILADKLNGHRWAQALSVEIPDRQRGAPEARAIQSEIKSKLAVIKAKYIKKSFSWKSPAERLAKRCFRELANQQAHDRLAADAANGYPSLLLGVAGYTQSPLEQVALSCLVGGHCSQYARVGSWIISSSESVSWDNNKYSKSYHRQYGGVKTVDARTVYVRRWNCGEIENRDIQVSSWAGYWALKALIQSGVVSPVKVPSKLKSVQLNNAFEVRLMRTILGVSIYERTLAGSHYDYCALVGSVTFHADSIRECLRGLHKKTTEITVAKNSPINWDFCRALGFCETGIEEFCSDFNLDIKGNYSPEKIHHAVKTDMGTAAKYEYELRKVAKVLNYSI